MSSPSASAPPALLLEGIVKRFGSAYALRDGQLRVEPGTIHGVVGPNGAGKSTLLRVGSGQLVPDVGTVAVDGVAIALRGPRAALRAGIAMMPQEQTVVPGLTVEENVSLGHEPSRGGVVRRGARRTRVRETLERIGIAIDPRAPIDELTAAEQRMTMLARALYSGARVLVLDEPTAALRREDAERLLDTVTAARDAGTAIVYVSHRFAEIERLCDAVTVLRDGSTVDRLVGVAITADALVRAVVTEGAIDDVADGRRTSSPASDLPTVARLRGITGRELHGVDLDVRAGEIVGVCGLAGSGVTELLEALGGVVGPGAGHVEVDGAVRRFREPHDALRRGIAFLPAERSRAGMLDRPVRENLLVARMDDVAVRGFVTNGRERRAAHPALASFGLADRADDPLGALSGGNRQKVLLGRCVRADARVVVLDDPTVGVDVGARQEIHRSIVALADAGRAVVVAASEVEELAAVADRVVVLVRGRIAAELSGDALTPERLVERVTVEAAAPST
ncbi:MAG: sugar ABC transporter ATP-binding protein [Patulibacter sp.]|nr:sugar ABC transporter ATP-binding protein [Patulibacter sp.]